MPIMNRGTETQRIAQRLICIHKAWKRAQAAVTKLEEAKEVIRLQTSELREALHIMERHTERSHLLLDTLETNTGLVDEDGKRFDEVD